MAATLTSVNAALKVTWTDERLAEQLYALNPLLERIRKLKSTQVGLQAQTPIHTDRNWGYTALPAAGGNLNTAGQQGLAQATWQYTHHHMQVAIQGSAIDGTQNDTVSVANAIDLEVNGALADLSRQLSRQLVNDGSGTVATTGVTTASNTVVLNPASGFNAIERGWLAGSAGQGSMVDIGTAANPVSVANNVQVTGVVESATAPTITVSGAAITTAAGNIVTLHGSRVASTSLEANGLDNIVSSSTPLGGVAASGSWAAANEDATSQALTLDLMYTQNRKIRQKTGKNATYVVTGEKQLQNFYKLTQAQVRFSSDTAQSVGAVDSVNFNGMEVHAYADVKNEQMYFLTIEDLLLVTPGDPYWVNKVEGGEGPLRWIQGTDSFGSKLTWRLQIGARRRNSQAKLSGLS